MELLAEQPLQRLVLKDGRELVILMFGGKRYLLIDPAEWEPVEVEYDNGNGGQLYVKKTGL